MPTMITDNATDIESLRALIQEKMTKKPSKPERETYAQHSEWCQGCVGCTPEFGFEGEF